MKTEVLEQSVVILTLAQQIGALHRDIEGRYEEMFGLLTQAKKDAGEGGWLKWLADNEEVLGFGERQARRYLREPDARVSDRARHAEGERKRRAAAKDSKEATTESLPATELQNQTVEITASQNGRRGRATYAVAWTESNGSGSVQSGYRTLEEALTFCPCSMDPDTVKRVVVPGVRVNNPVPKGMYGHNGSYLLLDGEKVPGSEVPPNLWTDDEADDVEPEDETTEVLEEIVPSESAATMLKGKATKRATKSDEHGVSYRDSLGRRRPRQPIQDRMERISWGMETGIEVLGGILIDARNQGYRDFPLLIQKATTWRSMLDAVLDLAQREPCPTEADLKAILNPDNGDPEPEP
jgi:hypothetical protein